MPAYLVQLPASMVARTLIGNADALVVFATDSAGAKAIAKARYSGDSDAMWEGATVTEIAAATSIVDYDLRIRVIDPATGLSVVDETIPLVDTLFLKSAAIQAAGTGYEADDVLTVDGGTGTAAEITVLTVGGGGEIETVAVTGNGAYTVTPDVTANPVTGGAGTGAAFDLTMISETPEAAALIARNVLNALAEIAGSAFNFSTNVLTVAASGEAGDMLGDHEMIVELLLSGQPDAEPIAGFVVAVTDEGAVEDALTFTVAADNYVFPTSVTKLRSA